MIHWLILIEFRCDRSAMQVYVCRRLTSYRVIVMIYNIQFEIQSHACCWSPPSCNQVLRHCEFCVIVQYTKYLAMRWTQQFLLLLLSARRISAQNAADFVIDPDPINQTLVFGSSIDLDVTVTNNGLTTATITPMLNKISVVNASAHRHEITFVQQISFVWIPFDIIHYFLNWKNSRAPED